MVRCVLEPEIMASRLAAFENSDSISRGRLEARIYAEARSAVVLAFFVRASMIMGVIRRCSSSCSIGTTMASSANQKASVRIANSVSSSTLNGAASVARSKARSRICAATSAKKRRPDDAASITNCVPDDDEMTRSASGTKQQHKNARASCKSRTLATCNNALNGWSASTVPIPPRNPKMTFATTTMSR